MVSDIVLVLRSEHRDLVELAQQCARPSRGFEDPAGRLYGRLSAHLRGVERAAEGLSRWVDARTGPMGAVIELLGAAIGESADRQATPALAWSVVDQEECQVIPVLEREVPLLERRRAGKSFRLVRDSALRGHHPSSRRVRPQAELYAVARRAGLEQRSRMTQSELQKAVEAWERDGAH